MNYKEMVKQIFFIAKVYKLNQIKILKKKHLFHSNLDLQKYLLKIDNILINLSKQQYKEIIINNFFEVKNQHWWKAVFPKSTYYRLSKVAYQEFLDRYNAGD